MIVLLWVLVLGLGTFAADGWLERRALARAPRAVVTADGSVGLELVADARGHYSVIALINGEPVELLVDTGASAVSLPEGVARRLGLRAGRRIGVHTANGPARVRATRLERLEVGPLLAHDVEAWISPGLEGETGLLGMSFLRRYELVQRGGTLLLRPPSGTSPSGRVRREPVGN